jgi:hypothetical protein
VNQAAITTLQLNGTDVAMTSDNVYVLQQITYEMLADVSSAPVSITKPLVRAGFADPLRVAMSTCYRHIVLSHNLLCSTGPVNQKV